LPERGSKNAKYALFFITSGTNFIDVKTISGKFVRHSQTGLSNRAKMVGGGSPFYLK